MIFSNENVKKLIISIGLNNFKINFSHYACTISGPPESPLQESFPPSRYPAQTISGQILT